MAGLRTLARSDYAEPCFCFRARLSAKRNEFRGVVGDLMKIKDGDNKVQRQMKGVMPDTSVTLGSAQGAMTHTGIETNFAIEGDGFFRIRKPDGTVGYTRNGNFRLNEARELVTQQGFPVDGENGALKFRRGRRCYPFESR